MRFEVKATRDLHGKMFGEREFPLSKGETTEISGQWLETVMHKSFGNGVDANDDFELVREVPETPEEKARVERAEAKKALMKQPKEKLVKKAEKLDIPDAETMNKEPLANAIAETEPVKGVKK